MTFFDILFILLFWMGYDIVNRIAADIAHSANSVEFNNRVGFLFVGVGIPVAHLFAIYEYFWPNVVARRNALFNYMFLILLIVLFVCGFFISARVQAYVARAGYLHCPQADRQLSFSTGLVYTKDDAICSQLIEEKRKPRRY